MVGWFFSILCGNNDDHARNHAALWKGKELTLTPAHDLCPQGRTGHEASTRKLMRNHSPHCLSSFGPWFRHQCRSAQRKAESWPK